MIELTGITKSDGPLTKRISLADDGSLLSDGSACVMSGGSAGRIVFQSLSAFAAHIARLGRDEAIALGALHGDLPDNVGIVTKARLSELNGHAAPNVIARTANHIAYRPGRPALALLDFDRKGMPAAVQQAIDQAGGFWPALLRVLPELAEVGRVERTSTSAGIVRADTGTVFPGSGGLHIYVMVADGGDIERFLRVLHARCWLAGYGWLMVGAGGQLLERSIVDRTVGAGERLVFEGAPILLPPLTQDPRQRAPLVTEGEPLDSRAICLDLSAVEHARFRDLRAAEERRLAPTARTERAAFIERQAVRIAERTGCNADAARRAAAQQCQGVLLPNVVLPWDLPDLAGCTVADVLADPARFEGATLADPLEGQAYGACKAKVLRRPDGSPWIHSFAHGRTTYDLRYDAAAVEAAMRETPERAADVLVRLAPLAKIEPDEDQALRDLACELAEVKARPLAAKLKMARAEHQQQRREAELEARGAHQRDSRLRLEAPEADAERLPVVLAIDEVLATIPGGEPPMRDADGRPVEARCRTPILLHDMTNTNADALDETNSATCPRHAASYAT